MFNQITYAKDIPFTPEEITDLNKSYVRLSSEEDTAVDAISQLQSAFKADKSKLESNLGEITIKRKAVLDSINKGYRTVEISYKSFIDEKNNKQYLIATEQEFELLEVRELPKYYQTEMSFSGFNIVNIDTKERFLELLEKHTDIYFGGIIAILFIDDVNESFRIFGSIKDPVLARVSLDVQISEIIKEYEDSLKEESEEQLNEVA